MSLFVLIQTEIGHFQDWPQGKTAKVTKRPSGYTKEFLATHPLPQTQPFTPVISASAT